MSKKPTIFQRVFAIVGGMAFLGSTAFATTTIFREALTPQNRHPQERTVTESLVDKLASAERGYEKVLQREPENQIALEGLANVRIQRNNALGAMEPLETLVKLYPERSDYQMVLDRLKQQVGEGTESPQGE
ncbi:MAG: tetratricopeptide repeat protein [Hormoscilla sp.]